MFIAGIGVSLFAPVFLSLHEGPNAFWLKMPIAAVTAVSVATAVGAWRIPGTIRMDIRRVAAVMGWGTASALFLYALFYAGVHGIRLVWPEASGPISEVYALRRGISTARMLVLLMLIIAPAEECFWRGALQKLWVRRWGHSIGIGGASALYAAVHLGSGNLLLVVAAGLCGVYWGLLYAWRESLGINILSHALWDALVFVWAPL